MKKKKIIFIIVLIIIVILSIIVYLFKKPNKEKFVVDRALYGYIDFSNTQNVTIAKNEKINTSPKIKEKHQFQNYEISNMKIYTKKNICYIEFDLKNISYTGGEIQMIDISFYNKKGEYYDGAYAIIEAELTPGKSKKVVIKKSVDVSNVYDYSMMTTF